MATKKKPQAAFVRSAINTPVRNYHVYKLSTTEALLYRLLLFVAGGLVGQVFYGGLFQADGEATLATYISNAVFFCIVGLIAVRVGLPMITESLRLKRLNRLKLQFRDFLVSLSTALSSGMNVNNALLSAGKDLETQFSADALIVTEVNELIDCLKSNVSLEESLANFGDRSDCEDISNFAVVFSTCLKKGGNLKEVIRRTSDIIGDKLMINEEIETKLTSNKMQMNVMLFIPIVVVVMMKFMSADFQQSLTSIVGVIAITISLGIFLAAYKIGQKIVNIKG